MASRAPIIKTKKGKATVSSSVKAKDKKDVKSIDYFSVLEASESEESPALALSPLRKPMMHEMVPYQKKTQKNQKIRKG